MEADLRVLLMLVFSRSLSDIALKSVNGSDGGSDESGIEGGSCACMSAQVRVNILACAYARAKAPTTSTNTTSSLARARVRTYQRTYRRRRV